MADVLDRLVLAAPKQDLLIDFNEPLLSRSI